LLHAKERYEESSINRHRIFTGLMMVLAMTSPVSAQNKSAASNLPASPAIFRQWSGQHDFFYAENPRWSDVYRARRQITWTTRIRQRRNQRCRVGDQRQHSFLHQFGVTEISTDKKCCGIMTRRRRRKFTRRSLSARTVFGSSKMETRRSLWS